MPRENRPVRNSSRACATIGKMNLGKPVEAHNVPTDTSSDLSRGQVTHEQIAELMRDRSIGDKFVFVEDYDINVGRHFVQGVDVWLNNPRRPLEASGTSGQKVVLNGGLNLSVLDGWWAEAYDGMNGFAIGTGRTHSNADVHDANSLLAFAQQSLDSDSVARLDFSGLLRLIAFFPAEHPDALLQEAFVLVVNAAPRCSNDPVFCVHVFLYVREI